MTEPRRAIPSEIYDVIFLMMEEESNKIRKHQ
jgi:hypothetical protein